MEQLLQPAPPVPSNRKYYAIAGAVAVVILLGLLGWYLYAKRSSTPTPTPTVSASTSPSSSTTPSGTPVQEQTPIPTPNTSVIWRGQGVSLADLGLVGAYRDDMSPPTPGVTPEPVMYYDMGTNGSKKIILAKAAAVDPSGPAMFFFEQFPGGYTFMAAMSSQYNIYTPTSKSGYELTSRVTATDTTTFYNNVTGPRTLAYHGISLFQNYIPLSSDLFSTYVTDQQAQSDVTVHKLDTIADGDLYIRQSVQEQLAVRKFVLKLRSGLYSIYFVSYPFFSDNQVPRITWTGGIQNTDTYRTDANLGGCGNPGSSVVPAQDVSARIQQTGTTSDGQAIYEFKSQDDPIVTFLYGLGGKTYNKTTSQFEPVSLREFWSHHAVILYKNGLGEYALFTSTTYGNGAECGKPVVYLYPTRVTPVRVQVGASITASEPFYGAGWNVQAQPDGTLTTADGRTYPSLYWEGIGQGNYPAVTEGTVVSRANVAATLRSQLTTLGLSKTESADFLEFWLPKMPATPYTRLTWFTTPQLDELAPLVVVPRPDTTIRVFLDFQGLEKSVSLPTQHLTSTLRRGFTLVEWGGLLRK